MDFFNKLGKKASETYQFTKEKTTKLSEELKLRNRINENKSKIEDIYLSIGESAYNEFATGEKTTNIEEKCKEVSALKEENLKMEAEILSIKDIKKCISCGEKISKDSIFCNKCGTKQPEIVEVKEEPAEENEPEVKEAEVVEEDKKEE